jgi:uncharacterized DUF497 family protein
MKIINWNEDKNELLKKERGISFEMILDAIESGMLLDNIKHPNQEKYPNQSMLVLAIEDYVYIVPYVETEQELFLKTIIPSRKMRKKYLEQ